MLLYHITASLVGLQVVELNNMFFHADIVRVGSEVDRGGRGHADAQAAIACLEGDSMKKFLLEFWLEKLLEFVLENPKVMFKNG